MVQEVAVASCLWMRQMRAGHVSYEAFPVCGSAIHKELLTSDGELVVILITAGSWIHVGLAGGTRHSQCGQPLCAWLGMKPQWGIPSWMGNE